MVDQRKPPVPPPPRGQYVEPIELSGIPDGPEPDSASDFADRFDAAIADIDNVDLVDLEGSSSGLSLDQSADPARNTAPASAEPRANLEPVLDRDSATGMARPAPAAPAPASAPPAGPPPGMGPDPGGDLQLDFDAVGIDAKKGQAVAGVEPVPVPVPESSNSQLAPTASQALMRSPDAPATGKVGLFGSDRILGFLAAGAIGLLLALYPALEASRRYLKEESAPSIAQLEESVSRPLAVRAGDLRTPNEITGDLERVYAGTRSRFWTVWFGVAVPLGLALAFIRRKA